MKENKIILTCMVIASLAALIVAITVFWIYGPSELVIEAKNKITLEHLSKIIQMLFYIIGSTVAVKTYLSAKKGLLNTVNTEYQKKVILKLEELSNKLYSEFNPDSELYWLKNIDMESNLGKYVSAYLLSNRRGAGIGLHVPKRVEILESLLNEVKSDPFIPEPICDFIVKHIENRSAKIFEIYLEEGQRFKDELNSGDYRNINSMEEWDYVLSVVSNRINDKLYKNDCGISQVEAQIHEIRIEIRKYLKSYDPFAQKPWYEINRKK